MSPNDVNVNDLWNTPGAFTLIRQTQCRLRISHILRSFVSERAFERTTFYFDGHRLGWPQAPANHIIEPRGPPRPVF
jgi:hypothetical protein